MNEAVAKAYIRRLSEFGIRGCRDRPTPGRSRRSEPRSPQGSTSWCQQSPDSGPR